MKRTMILKRRLGVAWYGLRDKIFCPILPHKRLIGAVLEVKNVSEQN
jgi:hypothetical protein